MVPKKAKDLYKILAEEQNLPEQLIQDVIEYYYGAIKKNLVNLSEPRINVHGLGHFITKSGVIDRGIIKVQNVIATQDESTFKGYHYKKQLEEKLIQLNKLQNKLLEVKEKKESFKNKENESSTKSNLGE